MITLTINGRQIQVEEESRVDAGCAWLKLKATHSQCQAAGLRAQMDW
jgi:hypothetical protein